MRRASFVFGYLLVACGGRTSLDDVWSGSGGRGGSDGAAGGPAANGGRNGMGGGANNTGAIGNTAGSGATPAPGGMGGRPAVDACRPNPCEHGGKCLPMGGGAVCRCPDPFTGDLCELPRFEGLGILPEAAGSMPAAISKDGKVVVGHCIDPQVAFRWDKASSMTRMTSADHESSAKAIDAHGSVVVGSAVYYDCEGCQGYQRPLRWEALGLEDLGLPPSQRQAVATGISVDAEVIIGCAFSDAGRDLQGFRWTRRGGFQLTGPGTPMGMSDDSLVTVGYRYEASIFRAMRWTAEGEATELDMPAGQNSSIAYAANADGSVIVGSSSSATLTSALRWSERTGTNDYEPLPGDVYAAFYATNEDGSVAVGVSHERRPPTRDQGRALIWDETFGMRALEADLARARIDIGAWKLVHASAVSADGRVITGFGTNPSGQTEAWIVRLP